MQNHLKANFLKAISVFGMLLVSSFGDNVVMIEIVSKPYTNSARSFGDTLGIELSATGEWAALTISGNELAAVTSSELQVFLRNTRTGETFLVTRGTNGLAANGSSVATSISADGRYLTFESDASDLVAEDDNDSSDIFLFDRVSARISPVTRSGDGESFGSMISADGEFVVFESEASNLAPGDANGGSDLFLLDRESGGINLVSAAGDHSGSARPPTTDFEPSISEDGRYLAFLSAATNLVDGFVPASTPQLFLRDRVNGTNLWVSRGEDGQPEKFVRRPVLSADGSYLAFIAGPESFPRGITNATGVEFRDFYRFPGRTWVSLYSVRSNILERVPLPAEFSNVNHHFGYDLALSTDGRYLAYTFGATDQHRFLYLYDRIERTNRLIAPFSPDASKNWTMSDPRISANGQRLTFITDAISGGKPQLYLFEQASGELKLLSRASSGAPADDDVVTPAFSSDGSTAGFISRASNLAPADDQKRFDGFMVSTTGTGRPMSLSIPDSSHPPITANGSSKVFGPFNWLTAGDSSRALSLDGRRVVFMSDASDLVPGDTNETVDLFVRDLVTGSTRAPKLAQPGEETLFTGMSADGARIAFYRYGLNLNSFQPNALHIYDFDSNSTSPAILPPDAAEGDSILFWSAGLSVDGRYLNFGLNRLPYKSYVYDAQEHEFTRIEVGRYEKISRGGRYFVTDGGSSSRILDSRNQSVKYVKGTIAGWSQSDEIGLLGSPGRFTQAEFAELYLYYPGSNASNFVATNVSFPTISGDGSTVVFGQGDRTLIYSVASQTTTAIPGDHRISDGASLSPDGRFVAFAARSAEEALNVYVFDQVLTNLTLVNRTSGGGSTVLAASSPTISEDGRVVVFDSLSAELVSGDRNDASDVFVARLTPQDSDGDGLEDGWELLRMGNLGASAEADFDGDGATNLQEFQSTTNPVDPGSSFPKLTVSSAGGNLELSWQATPWRLYQLQYRAAMDGGMWQNSDAPIMAYSDLIRVPMARAATNRFYRFELVGNR